MSEGLILIIVVMFASTVLGSVYLICEAVKWCWRQWVLARIVHKAQEGNQ